MDKALTYRLLKFKKLVTRSVIYPYDVVLRSDTIVLVSDQSWFPPQVPFKFRNWSFGSDWHIVVVPGFSRFELALQGHIEREGIEI